MKALTSALALMLALPLAAQADAPPAAADLLALYGCETARFTAVKNDAGEILYWNNPTCVPVGGPSDLEAAAAAEAAKPAPVAPAPTPVATTPVATTPAPAPVETAPADDKHI